MNNRVDLTTERGLALAVDNLREISDMLVANSVTALPFPAPNATARNLRAIADALAALATATPAPPAAEAGTGGGDDLGARVDGHPGYPHVYGGRSTWWITTVHGERKREWRGATLRAAIEAALAALDTPQEADHAAR